MKQASFCEQLLWQSLYRFWAGEWGKECCRISSPLVFNLTVLLRYSSHKVYPFKVEHLVDFSIFIDCGSITTVSFQNIFITPKRNPVHISTDSPFPLLFSSAFNHLSVSSQFCNFHIPLILRFTLYDYLNTCVHAFTVITLDTTNGCISNS